MSTQSQAESDLREKYIKGEKNNVEVEMMEDGDQHDDVEPNIEKKLPAVRNSRFRVFTVSLAVLYLLILTGIITRYILETLRRTYVEKKLINLSLSYNQSQDFLKQLQGKVCPEGWMKYGCNCYFKSTEEKNWFNSRTDCVNRGSDLVVINSKEEQDFVIDLIQHKHTWIGLRTEWAHTGNKWTWRWTWVDGSSVTQTFWATGEATDTYYLYAAYSDEQRGWRSSSSYHYKNYMCEKKSSCFL